MSHQLGSSSTKLSLIEGPNVPPLWDVKLGTLIDEQAARHEDRAAVVFPWQNVRMSYQELSDRSKLIAKAFLDCNLRFGDCIGIVAGNRFEYTEAFLGAARVGCPYVVLNATYTPDELVKAVSVSACKLLLIATWIGPRDMSKHIEAIVNAKEKLPNLRRITVLPNGPNELMKLPESDIPIGFYNSMVSRGASVFMNNSVLRSAERRVSSDDIVNLQFTSGTTGSPKAAMLTHKNLINNAKFIGDRMAFTPTDIVCCPPPLFHCFGLVMGFLCALAHGCTIVFPSDVFDADLTLDALEREKCTSLYGVPTMFLAELEANKIRKRQITSVKTGLAAGASVPTALMQELEYRFGIEGMNIAYGMTETSPVTFMTRLDDRKEKRLGTVGTVFPHTWAKVVDRDGKIVPRGTPGELCTSGFALQKGYWRNQAKTDEVMKKDEQGRLWIHTGDECVIDDEGYCTITGRIKDIIIRGGENIFPGEIEVRLVEHSAVVEACVVGLKDKKYGEAVACFLRSDKGVAAKPSLVEIRAWVQQKLSKHKAPQYVFWIDDPKVGPDFPKTGSGKHQKHKLRALGNNIIEERKISAKL